MTTNNRLISGGIIMSTGFNTGISGNQSFIAHLCQFIGQTVTIFTTSGGASGCGFTGVILSVNCNFVRLTTQQGTSPSNPLSESICGNNSGFEGLTGGMNEGTCNGRGNHRQHQNLGSVCDIPIDRIAAFCHNAV
jgi:hypothetical protein